MNKRIQITIKGSNVQRCGFRKAAVEMAKEMQLTGTAMYIDHDLLVEVEGDHLKVQEFATWAKKGPSQCDITAIELKEMPVNGYSSFKVIHGVVSGKLRA